MCTYRSTLILSKIAMIGLWWINVFVFAVSYLVSIKNDITSTNSIKWERKHFFNWKSFNRFVKYETNDQPSRHQLINNFSTKMWYNANVFSVSWRILSSKDYLKSSTFCCQRVYRNIFIKLHLNDSVFIEFVINLYNSMTYMHFKSIFLFLTYI